MKKILKDKIKRIEFHKGHFDVYGFFEMNDGRIWYFSTGDLRWAAQQLGMLLRTAKDFQDWTGGPNHSIQFDDRFVDTLLSMIDKPAFQQI